MKSLAHAVMLITAALTVACTDNSTTINEVSDCGLVREELVGTWDFDLAAATRSLQDCTGINPGQNGTVVGTDDFPATYSPMDVFGSDGSTSFKLQSDRTDGNNDAADPELTGSVQADSCVAIVRLWDRTDALFLQCIGSFNRVNLTLSGACDSAEIDTDTNGQLDTSCSLSDGVQFDASVH